MPFPLASAKVWGACTCDLSPTTFFPMADPAPEKPVPSVAPEDNDSDLDDLLDEFDEQILSQPPGVEKKQESQSATTKAEPAEEELTHDIEKLIKDLKIEDPEAKAQFEQLVKQFEQTEGPKTAASNEKVQNNTTPAPFDNVMRDTMQRLRQSGQNIDEQLKNDPISANPEDMLAQLLSGMGSGESGDVDMSKLLTDMLEQLLSKEVLYDPIKDLNTKFPEYLKEKKGVLPDDEHHTYTKQYELTTEIVAVFEAPEYNGDDEATRDKVNALLESLQELGSPPTELVGEDKDFPGFGGEEGLDFNSKDLPPDFEKELEQGCKQT